MKAVKYALLTFVVLTFIMQIIRSCEAVNVRELPEGTSVIVFHAAIRCPTCRTMERLTKELLDNLFSGQDVAFYVMDYQAPENQEIVKRFGIATATVVFLEKEGNSVRFENLVNEAWETVGQEERFTQTIRTNLERFLKKESAIQTQDNSEGTIINETLNWE